jgi:hypothetical protein
VFKRRQRDHTPGRGVAGFIPNKLKFSTLPAMAAVLVQVVVERLMAFLRSTSCGGDEVMRRHIAGQIVELAEKYAPDTAWYIRVMAEVGGGGVFGLLLLGGGAEH